MPGLRFRIDLYVPEDLDGTLVLGVKIPKTLATRLPAIRLALRDLKSFARRINTGTDAEEMTVRATYHICTHEESLLQPCTPDQDI